MLLVKCLILLIPIASNMPLRFLKKSMSKKIFSYSFLLLCFLFYRCKNEEEVGVDKAFLIKYHNQAVLLRGDGDGARAIKYVDSVHEVVKEFSRTQSWQKHNFKADIYLNRNVDLKQARLTIDSMYAILDGIEEQHPELYIYTKFFEGDLLLKGSDYNAGLIKYYEGESFGKAHLTPCVMSSFTGKIGLIKYRQRRYKEAIPYLKKTLIELSACTERDNFNKRLLYPQSNLNTIGLCFEKAGMPDSAVVYYKK